MADVGDYWREHRESQRKALATRTWCLGCMGRKVYPGDTCIDCGEYKPTEHELRRKREEQADG